MDGVPRLLKTKDVCVALNVSRSTLYKLMRNEPALAPTWVGSNMRWHQHQVDQYVLPKQKPIRGH